MEFKTKLYNILRELKQHNKTKNELFYQSVECRLNDALVNYSKDIAQSYNYLYRRDSLRVMNKLNKRK